MSEFLSRRKAGLSSTLIPESWGDVLRSRTKVYRTPFEDKRQFAFTATLARD
jgi:hypothetical protein